MRKIGLCITLLGGILSFASAQALHDSLFFYPTAIVSALPDAQQLEVDNEGNVFLLDSDQSKLYKYLADTGYDSAVVVGGMNARQEGFLNPSKIRLKNRQNVYLLDEAERRILLLNTNLKPIEETDFLSLAANSSLYPSQAEELYPISFDVGPSGEKFILNQGNNKVYKINQFGELELVFGGLDYGDGALFYPTDLQASHDNLLYISEVEDQRIQVYDNFGLYLYELRPDCGFEWTSFRIYQSQLILFNAESLAFFHLKKNNCQTFALPSELSIHDLQLNKDNLYLLSKNSLYLYAN